MAASLYETDYYLWARRQAQALRQLAKERWNGPLDLEELAEEVDDLAKRDRNACRSQLVRIMVHLLKLDFSPDALPKAGWKISILGARRELRDDLTRTLRQDLSAHLEALFADALAEAALALEPFGDAEDALPDMLPYTLDELLRDGFYGFKATSSDG